MRLIFQLFSSVLLSCKETFLFFDVFSNKKRNEPKINEYHLIFIHIEIKMTEQIDLFKNKPMASSQRRNFSMGGKADNQKHFSF